jgi:cytochrome c biogenesis protein CcdA
MVDLKFVTVITTALVDSINPCAIGVLILLISTLMALSKNRHRMLMVGLIYISAVYVAYFSAGLGLLYFIQRFQVADLIGTIVGVLVILLGFIEIKDFFWYGRGISLTIPKSQLKKLKQKVTKASIPGVIILGFFVAAVELPCTGGPYLAITTILAKDFQWIAVWYLVIYNFIFVLPLIIILLIAYTTSDIKAIEKWKTKHRKWMRLATGLVMVALGILLILYARGDISI